MKHFKNNLPLSVCFLLLIAAPHTAAQNGDIHPLLDRGFALDIGWFLPDREHKLSAAGQASIEGGPDIDFFEEFGVKKQATLFAGELDWKFGKRWAFRAQYFKSDGEQRATLEEDIEWEDLTFLAGTNVAIGSEFQLTRFFFGRSMNAEPVHDFGIGAGVHWMNISAFIEGQAVQPGGATVTRREAVGVEGPMPTIGIWYARSLSPRWALTSRIDYMNANIDKYDGRFVNAAVGVNYAFGKNFGLGAAYNYIELDVGVSDANWRGAVDIDYRGFYINFSWFWR